MAPEPSAVVWVPGDGTAATLSAAARAAGRADLVVLMPGIEPYGDWLDRLLAAACSDTAIASASAMLAGGPRAYAPEPLPAEAGALGETATQVAADSGRLRPRIAAPLTGCVLLRRTALDAAGTTDDDDSVSPAAALAGFGERCTALGLSHVLADDVLAAGAPATPTTDEARRLDARHPHRAAARALDARPESPVSHALLVAGRHLDRLSVTIDGRGLAAARAGTQVHALELVAALGRTGRVRLRVVAHDLDPQTRAQLEAIEDLTLLEHEDARSAEPTDVVHRPSQVFELADLNLLAPLGHRLVVTHQDLIGYRIPGYHESPEVWQRYRRVTEWTLSAADHVVFFSEHARRDALADNLVEQARASVVPIGVDHRATERSAGRRPAQLPAGGAPYLLCLGADLAHKHQAFAIALAAALRAEHGWDGRLVLAGPDAGPGAAPRNHEDPAEIVRLGAVPGDEKAWLLHHAAAVVYPTLYEGFGLIPFEAAAAGTPCVFAAQTALAEVLPASAATIVAWDASATAAAVAPLLHPGRQRDAHVAVLRGAAAAYRWDATAKALVRLYERLVVTPPRELRRATRDRVALEQRLTDNELLRIEEWERFAAFREQIGDDGLGLVGPGGVLDAADQRALLALLSRRALHRPALGAARAAYRLAVRLSRRH